MTNSLTAYHETAKTFACTFNCTKINELRWPWTAIMHCWSSEQKCE